VSSRTKHRLRVVDDDSRICTTLNDSFESVATVMRRVRFSQEKRTDLVRLDSATERFTYPSVRITHLGKPSVFSVFWASRPNASDVTAAPCR